MNSWRASDNAPSRGTVLCALEAIGPGGREFVFGSGIAAFRLFVVRHADSARAYVNKCSHYSLPLNHRPDEFLTRDGARIMCRQHLAIFAIDDGACLGGACEGRGLQPIPIELRDGMIVVG